MSATISMSALTEAQKSKKSPRLTFAQRFLRAARRWQRNRAYNALSQLSDRQLEDIGISPDDIPGLVKGMFVNEQADTAPSQEQPARAAGQVDAIAKCYAKAA